MDTHFPVGIDVAKSKFDAAIWLDSKKYKTKVFPNSPVGFQALLDWLEPYGKCHFCMESTGVYSTPLATYLFDAQCKISVENPARIHAFGQSELARNKTDKEDAKMIARYCKLHIPALWQPAPLSERQLLAVVTRQNSLKEMKQIEKNRSITAPPIVLASIMQMIDMLNQQIIQIQHKIDQHIDNDFNLKKNKTLLESIPGIGKVLSVTLLGHVGDMTRFKNNKALVAYAGLNPMLQESGMWKGKTKLSKKGCRVLRKALYMPALTAMTFNPIVASLCNRLKNKNKSAKSIICAAMKKLLQLAYGVIKSGKPFESKMTLVN